MFFQELSAKISQFVKMVKFVKHSGVLSTVPELTIVTVPELYSALFKVRIVFGLFQPFKAKSTPVQPGMCLFFFSGHTLHTACLRQNKLSPREN
jgi:hypothetical protein